MFRKALITLLWVGLVFSVHAAELPDVLFVTRAAAELKKVLSIKAEASKTSSAEALILRHVDFERFESLVLKDSGYRFSPEQRKVFSSLFRRMLVKRGVLLAAENSPESFCESYDIKALEDRPIVKFVCIRKKGRYTIKLYIHEKSGGRQIYDMSINGSKLSRNYRATINKITRRDGVEKLLGRIGEKTRAMRKFDSRKPL